MDGRDRNVMFCDANKCTYRLQGRGQGAGQEGQEQEYLFFWLLFVLLMFVWEAMGLRCLFVGGWIGVCALHTHVYIDSHTRHPHTDTYVYTHICIYIYNAPWSRYIQRARQSGGGTASGSGKSPVFLIRGVLNC